VIDYLSHAKMKIFVINKSKAEEQNQILIFAAARQREKKKTKKFLKKFRSRFCFSVGRKEAAKICPKKQAGREKMLFVVPCL
jgi:hypothetical protein